MQDMDILVRASTLKSHLSFNITMICIPFAIEECQFFKKIKISEVDETQTIHITR